MKIEELIRKNYKNFTDTDKYILNVLINLNYNLDNLNMREISKRYNVSISSITRFSKKLGFDGFKHFKSFLKYENKNTSNFNSNLPKDRLVDIYKYNIKEFKKKDIEGILDKIFQAKRMIIMCEGDDESLVGLEMKRIFLSTGKIILNFKGLQNLKFLKDIVKPNDLIFFISFYGNNKYLYEFCTLLKYKFINTISITDLTSNKLSTVTDESIYISNFSGEDRSIVPYILVLELIYLRYRLKFIY